MAEEDLRGLTSAEAAQLLKQHGPNEIPEKETSVLEMIIRQFTGPVTRPQWEEPALY